MMQPPITQLRPGPNYTLHLTYATGERKIFDVTPYIRGSWYGKLRDIAYFKTVRPIDGGYGVEWPEGQDIAPDDLYRNSVSVYDSIHIVSD